MALGLALGAFLWIVLVALTAVGGIFPRLFSLSVIGGHVRLHVVVPLVFMCEGWVDPMMTRVRQRVGAETNRNGIGFTRLVAGNRARRWMERLVDTRGVVPVGCNSDVVECPVAPSGRSDGLPGPISYRCRPDNGGALLWIVCLTLFRFLLLRCVWRLCHWAYFLWRITRLRLRLMPTHSDGVAGSGFLELVHSCFIPLVLAISAVQSASFAEEISLGTMTFEAIYPRPC